MPMFAPVMAASQQFLLRPVDFSDSETIIGSPAKGV
jgi:hypothetical protein